MIVKFVTMEKVTNRDVNSVGSSRIRARWVAKYWDEASEYQLGEYADVMIFQKAWWEKMVYEFPGIKIFDICDPDWFESIRPHFSVMSACDAVTTSTQPLADYIKKILPDMRVKCIPDRVDLEEHAVSEGIKNSWAADKAKTIVWFGYSHNFHVVEKTLDLLMKHGLRLTVISDQNLRLMAGYEALKIHNVKYNYETVHDIIARHDLALLPENPTFKGEFKSNNKDLTAMALGVPVVKLPEDLERLMSSEERKKASEQGLKEVKEKYDVRLSVQEYKDLINEIKKDKM